MAGADKDKGTIEDVFDQLSPNVDDTTNMPECLVFVSQQSSCISCEGTLEAHNAVINVRHFGVHGLEKSSLV